MDVKHEESKRENLTVRPAPRFTVSEAARLGADASSMGISMSTLIRLRALAPYSEPQLAGRSPGAVLMWAGRLIDNLLTRTNGPRRG